MCDSPLCRNCKKILYPSMDLSVNKKCIECGIVRPLLKFTRATKTVVKIPDRCLLCKKKEENKKYYRKKSKKSAIIKKK